MLTLLRSEKTIAGLIRGGVPKRPTGADCKSAGYCLRRFESYPLHQNCMQRLVARLLWQPTNLRVTRRVKECGCSSMVEPQPSKLMTWVRFPSPAPVGSVTSAHVAQSVEHVLGKDEVTGSIPVVGSITENSMNEVRRG